MIGLYKIQARKAIMQRQQDKSGGFTKAKKTAKKISD
jgi:hypothetical protein